MDGIYPLIRPSGKHAKTYHPQNENVSSFLLSGHLHLAKPAIESLGAVSLREVKMRKVLFAFTIMLLSGFIQTALFAETVSGPESIPRMTKDQLIAQPGNSDFVIIDVRADHDWQDSNLKIKGAIREDPSRLDSWITKYPQDKSIVLYCT
jgi:hypothetical protein